MFKALIARAAEAKATAQVAKSAKPAARGTKDSKVAKDGKASASGIPAPAALQRERLDRLLAVLSDDALARENLDIVGAYAAELTQALTAPGTPEREQLQGLWAAALDRLTADLQRRQRRRCSGGAKGGDAESRPPGHRGGEAAA